MSLPIGTIARDIEKVLKNLNESSLDYDEQITDTYKKFDHQYTDRNDYKLWRCMFEPYFAHNKPRLKCHMSEDRRDWVKFARAALESNDLCVFWSLVSISPEIIERVVKNCEFDDSDPIWQLSHGIYVRLKDAKALPACPASCGIAAALFLIKYQYLHNKAKKQINQEEIAWMVVQIERWFRLTDQSWSPGKKVETSNLELERKCRDGRLRAGHDAYEHNILVKALNSVRPFISHSYNGADLQQVAARFALSAWLTARSRRLAEMKYQESAHGRTNFNEKRAKGNRRTAVLTEFDCLNNLVLATRDAARSQQDYLEFARYAYLMLRFIPNEFSQDEKIAKEIFGRRSLMFRYIKEAGLEVDGRYKRIEIETQPTGEKHETLDATSTVEFLNSENPRILKTRELKGYALIVETDQQKMNEWKVLREEFPRASHETAAGYLLTIIKKLGDAGEAASPHALDAAYKIALHYGFIRSAGKLLRRSVSKSDFSLTKSHVVDFVHAVRRSMSLEPFGMRQELIINWRNLIIECCDVLYLRDNHCSGWLSPDESLLIHETLIGRTHTHQRTLKFDSARRLYGKAAGVFEFDDIRDFYDRDYMFWRKPMGIATADTIAQFCQRYEKSSLGVPVMASMLVFGSFVSIIAVGQCGKIINRLVELNGCNVDDDTKWLVGGAEYWFKFRDEPLEDQIESIELVDNLVAALLSIAHECDPVARTLILAAEPNLLQLPWQYFFRVREASAECTERCRFLVALVPNLGTMAINRDDNDMEFGLKLVLSTDRDSQLDSVMSAVERTVKTAGEISSMCLVVGHGQPGDGGVTGVALGQGRFLASVEQWMDVIRAKHVVLHCCHGGGIDPIYMAEIGGVPGIGLAMGVETFIAPVTEVGASVAVVFQEELFSGEKIEIGECYLRAISREAAVMLYSIYGNPYERFVV
jgi:hypothetical protein